MSAPMDHYDDKKQQPDIAELSDGPVSLNTIDALVAEGMLVLDFVTIIC